jgi:cytochrome P450
LSVRSAEFARDPYSYYRSLREKGGIHFLPEENAWLVVSYEIASSILRQPAVFSSSPFAVLSPSLHGADPPDHTRMRRLLNPYFTPDRQHAQRESIERHTIRTLARIREMRKFDAVADLAIPIPFSVACEWMGLHETAARRLHDRPMREVTWSEVQPALTSDGVLAALARETDLTEAQLAEFSVFFLAASYGSSRDLLLLALWVLMNAPAVVEQVAADLSLIPDLVEEILRLEPSAHTLIRRARTDVVIEDKAIPANSSIWVSLGAANRDPAVFEQPDELRLDRSQTRNLAFGIGPHHCLGSPLGRLESQIILASLMDEIPRMRAHDDIEIGFWDDFPGGVPSSRQIRRWPLELLRQ